MIGTIASDRNAEVSQAQHRFASKFGKHGTGGVGHGAIGRRVEGGGIVHSGLSQFTGGLLLEIQPFGDAEIQMPTADRNGLAECNLPASQDQKHGTALADV
jgi:hypothetical protein